MENELKFLEWYSGNGKTIKFSVAFYIWYPGKKDKNVFVFLYALALASWQ
jgi:hypothetical protein